VLLVILNSGHYLLCYIYLNFAVTQTGDCECIVNYSSNMYQHY